MAHYPTLAYSVFQVRGDSLPANLRPPPELDTTLPTVCDFELEEKVLKEFEASQQAAEKLAAAQETPSKPAEGKASAVEATASGLGTLSLDTMKQEQKEKVARMRELTNADEATARFWLESWAWDLERATQEYFNNKG